MTTAADFVAAIRARAGTPFVDYGRSADGVDCAGIIQLAASDCGIDIPPLEPNAYLLTALCGALVERQAERWGTRRPDGSAPQHGDLVLLWLESATLPAHVAVYAADSDSIIHARPRRGVVEQPFRRGWSLRTYGCYALDLAG